MRHVGKTRKDKRECGLALYARMHRALEGPYARTDTQWIAGRIRRSARLGYKYPLRQIKLVFSVRDGKHLPRTVIKMSCYEALLYLDKNCCLLADDAAQDLALTILSECVRRIPSVFSGASAPCADSFLCPLDKSCGELGTIKELEDRLFNE